MRKFLATTVAGAGVLMALALAGVAGATTAFDPSSGKGFVGKGDLQIPWGWNDKMLQAEAGNVTFQYNEVSRYDVVCNGAHATVTVTKAATVHGSVAYDTRNNKVGKVTGFNLTGFDSTSQTGAVPSVGDSCPQGGGGTVSSVELAGTNATLSASDGAAGTGPTVIWQNGASVL